MRTFKSALPAILAGAVVTLLSAASAQAQATRTWVSGVGDDVNPCSRTAPCKTFAGAISKTAANGEINCLDPGGFGAVTITKSMTIDCIWIPGSILNAGTNAVNVPFDNFGADVRKTVRLRGINMQGADTGTNGVRITGGTTIAGGTVVIEDVVIDGNFAGTARGITDERTNGGKLFVIKTTVRDNGGSGIALIPASGTSGPTALLVDTRSVNNGNGGLVAGGGSKAMAKRSVFSGNAVGVDAESSAEIDVDDAAISGNGAGVFSSGGAILRVSNSDLALNGSAATGPWTSFGNNRVSGTPGIAPTAAGPASTDLGQK
jgi:hypothetical protein